MHDILWGVFAITYVGALIVFLPLGIARAFGKIGEILDERNGRSTTGKETKP